MEKHSAKVSIPFLGTIVYRRRNPIITAISEEKVFFEISFERRGNGKNYLKVNGVTFGKTLEKFLSEYLEGIGETGVNIEVNVTSHPRYFGISTYASLSGLLMEILGEKLGYEVTFDDIVKYSPLLETGETLNYLPIIMASRISSLIGKSIIYRLDEGYIELPSKTPLKIYVTLLNTPLVSRRIENNEFKDYFVHLEGRNIIESARLIQEGKIPYENIVFEEAMQYVFYTIEETVNLNIYFKSRCLAFPDLNYKTILLCLDKPTTTSGSEITVYL